MKLYWHRYPIGSVSSNFISFCSFLFLHQSVWNWAWGLEHSCLWFIKLFILKCEITDITRAVYNISFLNFSDIPEITMNGNEKKIFTMKTATIPLTLPCAQNQTPITCSNDSLLIYFTFLSTVLWLIARERAKISNHNCVIFPPFRTQMNELLFNYYNYVFRSVFRNFCIINVFYQVLKPNAVMVMMPKWYTIR